MEKTFSIYRSSAGSGKTRTLAKEYLKLALRYKADYFKYILAVTFTNKATQEMKDRILFYLDDFSNARENDLSKELQEEKNPVLHFLCGLVGERNRQDVLKIICFVAQC